MTDTDKLAQVLAEHMRVQFGPSKAAHVCECSARIGAVGSGLVQDMHAAHIAAVVLAHLTAEGWAQGREEWGVAGRGDEKPFMWGVSREDAELESAADGYRLMRRTAASTEWAPVETGDQK